jgi:CPA2 family monovalent cation:H+ antiporter-2
MPDPTFFHDVAIALAAALGLGLLCARARQPVIIGYLVAGLLVGPGGLGFVTDRQSIATLAELGSILLMFTLGIEFSFSELRRVQRFALLGGSAQIVLTTLLASLVAIAMHVAPGTAITLGVLLALSSTVLVLKVLMERGELDSAHGRGMMGLLLVQDLSVVLVVILMPHLGHPDHLLGWPLAGAVLKAIAFLGAVVWCGTRLVPPLLQRIASTRHPDLYLLTTVLLCFGTAVVAWGLGLSLALGAFVAGLVVSESDHGHQMLSDVTPLRDLFATLFFVSLGMLISPAFLLAHAGLVLGLVGAVVVGKATIVGAIARGFGYSGREALTMGLGLAQIGEFSFVLARMGEQQGLLMQDLFSLVLAVALVTLLITPWLMQVATPLYLFAVDRWPVRRTGTTCRDEHPADRAPDGPDGHVVIGGFGRVGRHLGDLLVSQRVPMVVVDSDVAIIEELRRRGIPCLYGDATRMPVLRHAGLARARILVVALPDPVSCKLTIAAARRLNPDLDIVARAHRTCDIPEMVRLGAGDVIQPEFEASLGLIRTTLIRLGYPTDAVEHLTRRLREARTRELPVSLSPRGPP